RETHIRKLVPMIARGRFSTNSLAPFLIIGASVLGTGSSALPGQEAKHAVANPPKSWAIATADTIMRRYPDFRTAYFRPWTYVHGYDLYGFEMLYRTTGDKKYFNYVKQYVDQIVDDKATLPYRDRKTDKIVPVNLTNLDNIMTGNTIVAMYEHTREEQYRIAAGHFRKAFDTYPRTSDGCFWHAKSLKGQVWIDGVFMGQMFLTR